MSEDDILAQLRVVVLDLDQAIYYAKKRFSADPFLGAVEPYMVTDANGRYIILDALTAKAQALAAMAQLEASP